MMQPDYHATLAALQQEESRLKSRADAVRQAIDAMLAVMKVADTPPAPRVPASGRHLSPTESRIIQALQAGPKRPVELKQEVRRTNVAQALKRLRAEGRIVAAGKKTVGRVYELAS